jgi:hypothetical protein
MTQSVRILPRNRGSFPYCVRPFFGDEGQERRDYQPPTCSTDNTDNFCHNKSHSISILMSLLQLSSPVQNINSLQPYRPPRPVTGIALLVLASVRLQGSEYRLALYLYLYWPLCLYSCFFKPLLPETAVWIAQLIQRLRNELDCWGSGFESR